MAERAPDPSTEGIAAWLELRPRRPTHRLEHGGKHGARIWRGVALGRIAATFDVVQHAPDRIDVLVLATSRIAADAEQVRACLSAILGPAEVRTSERGKGWWVCYPVSWSTELQLVVTFDEPTRRDKLTRLGAAMIAPIAR